MLRYDMKRAFSVTKLLMLGMIFAILFIVIKADTLLDIIEKGEQLSPEFTLGMFYDLITEDNFIFAIPVVSSLMYSSSYIEEWKSGIIRLSAFRVDKIRYLRSKGICVAISGAATIFTISLIVWGALYLILGSIQKAGNIDEQLLRDIIQQIIRSSMYGALWAELGLVFSVLLNHRYMAWLSPFILYYLLIILYERYFSQLYLLYPKEWIAPQRGWPWNNWSICVWLLCLVFLSYWVFMQVGRKKLEQI